MIGAEVQHMTAFQAEAYRTPWTNNSGGPGQLPTRRLSGGLTVALSLNK